MNTFEKFDNHYILQGKIRLDTPLRIGAGQATAGYSLSQSPVLVRYTETSAEPYIPGSSFKGVLRSTMERIIRTFNEEKSCISVLDKKNIKKEDKVLCGEEECIPCTIFGSMKKGAKIKVRDAVLSEADKQKILLEDRPHYGNPKLKGKGYFRTEELVVSDLSFDFKIELDNSNNTEIGMIILALYEFNNKRCYLGGSVSRGHGFASIKDLQVAKYDINLKKTNCKVQKLVNSAKEYLKEIDNGINTTRRDFDVYYNAYSKKKGHIVFECNIKTITNFIMQGAEGEPTVTMNGIPIIPGSTIKGFLRHKFIKNGKNREWIEDVFGSMKSRSRILISDAYPIKKLNTSNKIPSNTILRGWIVCDNMEFSDIKEIKDILEKVNVLTGNTSSNKGRINKVEFTYTSATSFDAIKYLKDSD
ncbi:MAG: RAMP superfamily CRISPR-associated protein [Methanosarcinales archaeon]